jgi:hypothetical protein
MEIARLRQFGRGRAGVEKISGPNAAWDYIPNCKVSAKTCRPALECQFGICSLRNLEGRMPVGLHIRCQKNGPSARCDQTSLSQVADYGRRHVSLLFVADSF